MRLRAACLLLLAAGCGPVRIAMPPQASSPAAAPAAPGDSAAAPGAKAAGRGASGGGPGARPYAQVITSDAVTRPGLFTTHRIGNKLYYEIPRGELGREMLLVTQIAKNTLGGHGGEQVGSRVLVWERRDDRILLRSRSHVLTADSTLPIYRAVEAANFSPVLAAFDIEAFGADSAMVIEVTRLFTASPPELGLANRIQGNLDRERTFVERVASFPTNVEVEATHTYNVPTRSIPGVREEVLGGSRTASVLVHWSMVRLPDTPMRPRLHDRRVGFFSVAKQDFGTEEHRVSRRGFITRWRLECPPGQSVPCEPARPIVYYLDPATPEKLRPWVKRGIEEWQGAFEEAGFRRAIVARDAPTPAEDPDWSPEDARYSVVRWVPSTIENAMGPHVHDPRSGEILEADILMYHNIQNLLRDWYFVQVAPLDPRTRRLPLPDSLMGRLVQFVVAHEVGHTLGFPHNMKASSMYPADSVRNAAFVERMGHTPSIMDYSRFNYVAQPEDGIPVERLVPSVGPYDRFAVMWGYRPVEGARTPEEERQVLDGWARRQDEQPWLRFSTPDSRGADFADHTEAVGDADAVRSTELGLRNIRRVVGMLAPATEQPGEDFSDLSEIYGRLIGQWQTELRHVVTLVGGVESQEKYWGQTGERFVPVRRQRQEEAVRFLNREAFRTPEYLLDREVLRRIEVDGALRRIGNAQAQLLGSLLGNDRLGRLVEFEALAQRPGEVYTLGELLSDVRGGVWSELQDGSVRIDAFRRNLQRAYLEEADRKLNPPQAPRTEVVGRGGSIAGDAPALLRGELRALDGQIRAALGRSADRSTRLHLEDARVRIQRILEPR